MSGSGSSAAKSVNEAINHGIGRVWSRLLPRVRAHVQRRLNGRLVPRVWATLFRPVAILVEERGGTRPVSERRDHVEPA